MNLKKSILKNSLASIFGKVSTLFIRLLQVPLFISTLGVSNYGHWIVLASLPSWLAISNLGFGSVAANEMSLEVAAGRIESARKVFSTAMMLIILLAIIGTLLITGLIFIIPLNKLIATENIDEYRVAIVLLSLSVFVSFFGEVYGGRFRAANKAHQSMLISSIRPWIELVVFFIILQFTTRFSFLALASLIATTVYAITKSVFSNIAMPEMAFSIKKVSFSDSLVLFKKGAAFQAFPLGNALLFQGNILVIQSILGPLAVVLFSTARTLVRSINQVMEMINQVVWPQFSLLLGANEYYKAKRLHRLSVTISILVSLLCILPLSLWGVPIYKMWTGKAIALNQNLLLLFLLPIPFNAIWYTSSVVHVACNKHEGLAIRYLFACGISLIACIILSYVFNINGAAVSTIFADIVLIPYVLSKSLELTHDSWREFVVGSIVEVKQSLKLKFNIAIK